MLYNDYRPRRFRDLVGQDAVVCALRNQVRKGRMAHAYLFGGPSGTGKTTVARILAAALNCERPRAGEPCGKCPSCRATVKGGHWDVIEMDAASQRGIDEVRDLSHRAYLSPMCNKKVYVVDEAHGLTYQAWQALLKTLEEPPPHLVWILCTTRPDALPDTVRSRCQAFRFQEIPPKVAQDYLARVARSERVEVSSPGLRFIAETTGGNLRQAITVLEQVINANGRKASTRQVRQAVQALTLPF